MQMLTIQAGLTNMVAHWDDPNLRVLKSPRADWGEKLYNVIKGVCNNPGNNHHIKHVKMLTGSHYPAIFIMPVDMAMAVVGALVMMVDYGSTSEKAKELMG